MSSCFCYIQLQIIVGEMMQRRAAHYILNRRNNTSSVSNMLNQLSWVLLETRRQNCQQSLFYKIVNNHVDIPPTNYLKPAYSRKGQNIVKNFYIFLQNVITLDSVFFHELYHFGTTFQLEQPRLLVLYLLSRGSTNFKIGLDKKN